MRCDQCNKFVSYEENDPEVDTVDVDEDGHVTVSVRIVNACQDCGQEMTEATLDMDGEANECPCKCKPEKRELEAEEAGSERTSRSEGAGRYAKRFYGARVDVLVRCLHCKKEWTVSVEDDTQASSMDSLI